ncbi:MAG: ABC transporter ATP-binding protein [Phycisphaerales bacterium]
MSPPRSSSRKYRTYRSDFARRRKLGDDKAGKAGSGGVGPDGVPRGRQLGGKRSRGVLTLFAKFFGLLRGHRAALTLAVLTLSVSTLVDLVPPVVSKIAIDNVIDGKPYGDGLIGRIVGWLPARDDPKSLLLWLFLGVVFLNIGSILIRVWGRWQATRITHRVKVDMRRRVFDHAIRLPLHRVFSLKSGGASSIIREDAGGVGDLVFAMIYNPAGAVIQLVGVLIILAVTEWRLLLGALVLLPVVFLTHRTWIGRIRPLWRDIRATRSHIDSRVTEAFGGVRVVRTFGRERTEVTNFTTDTHFMTRQELLGWWWNRAIDIVWRMLIPVALAGVLYYAGVRIISDRAAVAAGTMALKDALTVGDLFMFLWYLASLLQPLALLASSAAGLQTSLAGLDRVLDLMDEPLESPTKPGAAVLKPAQVLGRVAMEDVSFTYPKAPTAALLNASFTAEPGQVVALVGPSGAGKTTLCNLIARFYDPTSGTVSVDRQDLRNVNVGSYRSMLAIVEQDIFLFDGTVADNISYGRRGASEEEIAEAARLANAHGFIEALPKGYGTWIGERGVKLSGGQRQRLAIARALLAKPRILILDEATSNLDTESERLIQSSLRNLMKNRTSFVIAHRLSTIAHADQILVLENGRIVERGRHEELIARSGRYRQMVQMQTHPASLDDDEPAQKGNGNGQESQSIEQTTGVSPS